MPQFCTQCGTENVEGAAFCDQCGARMKQPAPKGAPPVLPPPVVPPVPVAPAPGSAGRTNVIASPGGAATQPLTSGPLGVSGPAAKLLVLHGSQPVREHQIHGVSVEVGRWDPANGAFPEVDLTEDDTLSQVSRHHARIYREGDTFFIQDLGSSNGTYLNRARLAPNTPAELASGVELILGRTFLRFERT